MATLPEDSVPLTRYFCRHGCLIARVHRAPDGDYWIETGPVKHSAAKAAAIAIKNRSIPRRFFRFDVEQARLFSGRMIMPDGSEVQVDAGRELAGCRDVQLVVSLTAMRDDALAGVSRVVLPDSARRVAVGRQ